MEPDNFEKLTQLVKVGARALGIDSSQIVARKGAISIVGANIDIWWSKDAFGQQNPGWQVRESYHVLDMLNGNDHLMIKTIQTLSAEDIYGAARTALITAAEKKIEISLGEADLN